jgi:hypothetical protein
MYRCTSSPNFDEVARRRTLPVAGFRVSGIWRLATISHACVRERANRVQVTMVVAGLARY